MIFNFITKAKQLFFDDSRAKTGSDNVQGAIENIKSDLESESVYCGEGDSYMGVNSSGEIAKITIAENESREITLTTKEAVQSHDKALEKVALAITPAYKGSSTVSKGGGTYSFPKPLEGDLKSVLGNGIYFVSVYSSNTAWRYAGILAISQLGTPVLTTLTTCENIEVSVVASTSGSTTTYKLKTTNKNANYDTPFYVTAVRLGGA